MEPKPLVKKTPLNRPIADVVQAIPPEASASASTAACSTLVPEPSPRVRKVPEPPVAVAVPVRSEDTNRMEKATAAESESILIRKYQAPPRQKGVANRFPSALAHHSASMLKNPEEVVHRHRSILFHFNFNSIAILFLVLFPS